MTKPKSSRKSRASVTSPVLTAAAKAAGKRQKVAALKWTQDSEDGKIYSFSAIQRKPYNLTFGIDVMPPTTSHGSTEIGFCAWIGETDSPLVDRVHKVKAPVQTVLNNISAYQTLIVLELAAILDAQANYVAGLAAMDKTVLS